MCGIAGYVGPERLSPATLDACLALMGRRGPDHAARREWRNAAGRTVHLLHTRLGIIDLDERANQPLGVGRKWLAHNGELYNYLEVRRLLDGRSRRFDTSSDTEVLLAAVDELGWDSLDRFEGMWAFAVYDEEDGSLTLSRDRFGEKPLFLFREGESLWFGSEPKFIEALRGRRFEVDLDHVFRFLVNGYKSLYKGERTFHRGLTELSPGTTLRIDARGRERAERYWTPRVEPDPRMSYEEAVEGARERLVRSVELRLRSDVPLAFCMSGGVDSNALISIAKNLFGYDVHGFTIVNRDERYDEQDLVEHAVERLGIRHTAIPVETRDFLPRMRTLVRQHDAPVYTITYYAHWLLQESIAAHGYRISVSGTAADELFSGYYDHHLLYLAGIRDDPDLHEASVQAWKEHVLPLTRNPHLQDPELFVRSPGFRDHVSMNAGEFSGYLTVPWTEPFTETRYTDDLLRNRMLNELFHEATPVILHEDDVNAMFFSIENRSPYLDRELFEFCNRIPSRHLVRDGRAKAVLRDAMAGIAPERVMESRRKVGFNAPIFSFLDVKAPDVRASLLDESPIFDHVRRDRVEALLSRDYLPNSESKFLFSFLGCKMFLEERSR